jgi:hypothetical protein
VRSARNVSRGAVAIHELLRRSRGTYGLDGVTPSDAAADSGSNELCPCTEDASCHNGLLGTDHYSAHCDEGAWSGTTVRDGNANPSSYSFSVSPCPTLEMTVGDKCLPIGQVCAYANDSSAGCDGARTRYSCALGARGGEWQPADSLCPALCPDNVPEEGAACMAELT